MPATKTKPNAPGTVTCVCGAKFKITKKELRDWEKGRIRILHVKCPGCHSLLTFWPE